MALPDQAQQSSQLRWPWWTLVLLPNVLLWLGGPKELYQGPWHQRGVFRRHTFPWITRGLWFVALFIALVAWVLLYARAPGGVTTAAVALLCFYPWLVTRWLVLPLGMPRLAFAFARLSDLVWIEDGLGGAAITGAWAMLRTGRSNPQLIERWQQRLLGITPSLGGLIVTEGFFAAIRGDLVSARALLGTADEFHVRACPALAKALAREWLMADATARGDWRAVRALARPGFPMTPTTWLMAGIAARLLPEPAGPSKGHLILYWAMTGRWFQLWPLLQLGLRGPPPRPAVPESISETGTLERAMQLHAQLLQTPSEQISAADLRALGAAWDRVFEDEELRRQLDRRSADGAQETLQSLRTVALADVVAQLRTSTLPMQEWPAGSSFLKDVAKALRAELLAGLEASAQHLLRRLREERRLGLLDEWQEYARLRAQYEAAGVVGGLELRRLAFLPVHRAVHDLAIWLFNEHQEKPLANAIFLWLLLEAKAVENSAFIELQTRNVALGSGV